MTLQLFSPDNKVQKDKQIIESIDTKIATFGRTSLIVFCVGFTLYLGFGSLLDAAPNVALILAVALPLLVGAQSYYLLRFHRLYKRGANRWRNRYLLATLLSNLWLATLLGSVTLSAGVSTETFALWLLVVVYLFTAIGIFAPYQRYCRLFLSAAFIPPFVCMLYIVSADSYLLAAIFCVIYAVLMNQTKRFSVNYWRWHEADFLLHQKMNALEIQTKGDNAQIELNYEFLANLGQELKTSLNDILGGIALLQDADINENQQELLSITEKASERQLQLVDNIVDFAKISKRTLILEHTVFNLRRELEDLFSELALEAHQCNVELNYTIQDEIAYRAKGDCARLKQIITELVTNIVRFSEDGEVFIDVRSEQINVERCELLLNIYDDGKGSKTPHGSDVFNAFAKIKHTKAGTGLGLAICKGIAECMGGTVGMEEKPGKGKHYWLKLPLETKAAQGHYFVPNIKLQGLKLLVVDVPEKIQRQLLHEFESWGLTVTICRGYRQALTLLSEANGVNQPFVAVLTFSRLHDDGALHGCARIAEKLEFKSMLQFVAASSIQLKRSDWQAVFDSHPQLVGVAKPLNYKQFHQLLVQKLFNVDLPIKRDSFTGVVASLPHADHKILLVEDHRVNQMVAVGMLKKLGYQPQLANNGREALEMISQEQFDLVLMDCQMAEMDGYEATQEIRQRENRHELEHHLPIIALTAHTAEEDQSRCMAAGMDDYLAKPVRYADLESRLRRWLGDQPLSNAHH